MGVAPPRAWGRITTILPRAHGGNMDNKELGAGATIYFPVFNEGGLFSVGDGHGAQGDGELSVTAVETALTGRFRLSVRDDMQIGHPRAETAEHYITMGFDEDLDDAVKMALRDMIAWLGDAARPLPQRRLHALQLRRRHARDADGQHQQGRALRAGEIGPRLASHKFSDAPANPAARIAERGDLVSFARR